MQTVGAHKRWRFKDPDAGNVAYHQVIAEFGVDPLVAGLLAGRGLADPTAAQAFLKPRLTDLHAPELLPGVVRAANRMCQAVKDGQPIVIYGDYDVDGVTASTILWHVLKQAGAEVSVYVPHRIEEGYGLNNEAIARLATDGPLIISVDCGINRDRAGSHRQRSRCGSDYHRSS